MKTSFVLQIAFVAVIVLTGGCSSDSGGGTTFISSFNATWPVEGDEDRQLDLQPDEDNLEKPMGVFEGEEILETENGQVRHPLEGKFNGLNIEFTITRDNDTKVEYKGTMTPKSETNHFIIRIDLSSPQEGNIVLARDG